MGPCTTAWFHSDWSAKVGPAPGPRSPSRPETAPSERAVSWPLPV